MDIENDAEYKGYGKMANLARKIGGYFYAIHKRISRFAEKMEFNRYMMKFGERDDDIYIVTYPKSGTTLMQVIMYQLTTKGSMDFEHIYQVSPWIRNASFIGSEPNTKLPSPRVIKSHDHYKMVSKGTKGRFIFVYRDGMDVAVSHFHQNKNYNRPDLEFEKYLKKFYKTDVWFKFCKSWFVNKHKFDVLYIKYEDLLSNKEGEIHRIIKHFNLKVEDDSIERAMKYSSFEYMKEHETKFGDQPPEKSKVYDQFIRKGKSGEGKLQFTEDQKKEFDKRYIKHVKPYQEKIFGKKAS